MDLKMAKPMIIGAMKKAGSKSTVVTLTEEDGKEDVRIDSFDKDIISTYNAMLEKLNNLSEAYNELFTAHEQLENSYNLLVEANAQNEKKGDSENGNG